MANKISFNLTTGLLPWSQRNNEYSYTRGESVVNWTVMCNVTCIAGAFSEAGWILPKGQYSQPEDNLGKFIIESKNVDDFYREHYPVLWNDWRDGKKDAYTPLEIHKILAFGVNEWLGCQKADTFYENLSIKDFVKQLYYNKVTIPVSGKFGTLNHIVRLVGFEYSYESLGFADAAVVTEQQVFEKLDSMLKSQNFIQPTNFIYDDPLGTFDLNTLKYADKTKCGNDNIMTYKQFIDTLKPLNSNNSKYAHIISRALAVV